MCMYVLSSAGFQTMPPQMRQPRPSSQGSVRAAMNARPITGQSGGAGARPGVPVPQAVPGRPPQAQMPPQQPVRPVSLSSECKQNFESFS